MIAICSFPPWRTVADSYQLYIAAEQAIKCWRYAVTAHGWPVARRTAAQVTHKIARQKHANRLESTWRLVFVLQFQIV